MEKFSSCEVKYPFASPPKSYQRSDLFMPILYSCISICQVPIFRFRDNRENDIAIIAKSLTDITTEITTNTPIVENEDEPAEETVFLVGVSLLKSQIHHGNPGLCLSSFTQNKNKTMRK